MPKRTKKEEESPAMARARLQREKDIIQRKLDSIKREDNLRIVMRGTTPSVEIKSYVPLEQIKDMFEGIAQRPTERRVEPPEIMLQEEYDRLPELPPARKFINPNDGGDDVGDTFRDLPEGKEIKEIEGINWWRIFAGLLLGLIIAIFIFRDNITAVLS